MLLSEVLYIAKNLKHINESLNSVTLSSLLHKFDRSNLTLSPCRDEGYMKRNEGADFFYVVMKYDRLASKGKLTQEMCDTVEGRQSVIKCTYTKKQKTKQWDGSYIDNTIIGIINRMLKAKADHNLGISDITDTQLLTITPEEAKKKIYKTGIQFWVDYEDQLRAVTIDNKIILYITSANPYNSWLEPNKNYNEKTDITYFATDSKKVEDFVNKAFTKIPVYDVLTSSSDIKKELGADNIKSLQKITAITKVYVVDPKYMDNIDITNKLNNRREYRDFVLSQTNLNKKNIERYRQILKVRKQESLDSKVIKNVNNFMDICFDVNMELQDLDNDILTNKKFDEFKLVSYWNQVNCDGIYASMIRQTYGSDTSLLFTTRERRPYGRGYFDQLVFSFKSIADCLIILNLKVQRCIDLSISVIEQYQKYIDRKNKSDVSHEVIAQEIDSLKFRFTSLRTFVEQDYSKVYQSAKELLEKNSFNITNITDKIDNFKFNI